MEYSTQVNCGVDVEPRDPIQVMPRPVGAAVSDLPYWFVIGGQAIRCFCPYRPSRDVDFGVTSARELEDLVAQLQRRGQVEITGRASDTTSASTASTCRSSCSRCCHPWSTIAASR
jgi:hypothetical protein